ASVLPVRAPPANVDLRSFTMRTRARADALRRAPRRAGTPPSAQNVGRSRSNLESAHGPDAGGRASGRFVTSFEGSGAQWWRRSKMGALARLLTHLARSSASPR